MKARIRYGYIDITDFDHELGEAYGGTVIYSSLKDIKAHKKCINNCGIAKVRITEMKVVQRPKSRNKSFKNSKKPKAIK